MTTLNTIIEEENIYDKLKKEALDLSELHEVELGTPDTEWEKELRKRYRSQTLKMAREVSQTGDYSKVEGMIVDWWLKELTSRDTYWKERVREVIDENQGDYESKNPEINWVKAVPVEALDTLLENLK